MAQDVPTRRGFVGEAIAAHGIKAWPVLKGAMADTDWRVRSCALYALEKLFPSSRSREEKARQEKLRSSMTGLIPVLTKALKAPHFWVRCSAAGLLGRMGEAAKPAAHELAKLCADKQNWVRTSAIEALRNIPDAPLEACLQGAINVLNNKRTSFGDSRFAMEVIRREGKKIKRSKDLNEALFHFVENPGEGMWSNDLSKAIEMLVAFKADPKRLDDLLNRVLTDPVYEQRGDPRTVVCREILKMDHARQFAPSLKKAVAREKDLLARGITKKEDQLKLLEKTLEQVQQQQDNQ